MPGFDLTLQKPFYDGGFFNVPVGWDAYVPFEEGSIKLTLGNGEAVDGYVNRRANQNGTAQITGGAPLRDWFKAHFKIHDTVYVDLDAPDVINLRAKVGAKGLSAGKLRGLTTLADAHGVFKMIAVDQRPPVFRALAKHDGRDPGAVGYDEVAKIKTLLTRTLAPEASAVLIDPIWAHPHALPYVPGRVGLLSTLEDHAFKTKNGERWSGPIEGWSVEKIKRSGAAGVKVLVWDRPDVNKNTRKHQDTFVRSVGAACEKHDIPFVLELLIYPKEGEREDSPEYAAAKPERVLSSVRHFSDDAFGVDLLKLEFPANLRYCREFAGGAFDGTAREAVYELSQVEGYLRDLDAATNVPWVLLSAGVGPREFALNLELAFGAGSSGFLAGRAVWLDALDGYPDLGAVERRLITASLPYLRQISALSDTARPWFDHPRYGGEVTLEGAAEDWAKGYGT